ncbi:MAG: hypothetical protein ACI4I4_01165 [Acutalibacteraceae bacterium]
MNENIQLLNFIFQNSQMGIVSIKELLPIIKDEKFLQQLKKQIEEYNKINTSAKEILSRLGYEEKGLSSFEKIRTYLMIDIQTLTDKSSSHIAEMLIIGSTMGVVKAIRDIHKCPDADGEIIKLMKALCQTEENNIENLKTFL